MVWIPANINPADFLTKKESLIEKVLQLMIYESQLCEEFTDGQVRSCEKVPRQKNSFRNEKEYKSI